MQKRYTKFAKGVLSGSLLTKGLDMTTNDTQMTPDAALDELIHKAKERRAANPIGAALEIMMLTSRPTVAAKQIKNLMPKIEELKNLGCSDKAITEILNRTGIKITLSSFKNAIFRIRKEQKQQ